MECQKKVFPKSLKCLVLFTTCLLSVGGKVTRKYTHLRNWKLRIWIYLPSKIYLKNVLKGIFNRSCMVYFVSYISNAK